MQKHTTGESHHANFHSRAPTAQKRRNRKPTAPPALGRLKCRALGRNTCRIARPIAHTWRHQVKQEMPKSVHQAIVYVPPRSSGASSMKRQLSQRGIEPKVSRPTSIAPTNFAALVCPYQVGQLYQPTASKTHHQVSARFAPYGSPLRATTRKIKVSAQQPLFVGLTYAIGAWANSLWHLQGRAAPSDQNRLS